MSESDELFTLRTYFWLGNYQVTSMLENIEKYSDLSCHVQGVINEANGMTKLKSSLVSEKDEWVYRAYIGQGQYGIVIGEVADNSSTPIGLFLPVFIFIAWYMLIVHNIDREESTATSCFLL